MMLMKEATRCSLTFGPTKRLFVFNFKIELCIASSINGWGFEPGAAGWTTKTNLQAYM